MKSVMTANDRLRTITGDVENFSQNERRAKHVPLPEWREASLFKRISVISDEEVDRQGNYLLSMKSVMTANDRFRTITGDLEKFSQNERRIKHVSLPQWREASPFEGISVISDEKVYRQGNYLLSFRTSMVNNNRFRTITGDLENFSQNEKRAKHVPLPDYREVSLFEGI